MCYDCCKIRLSQPRLRNIIFYLQYLYLIVHEISKPYNKVLINYRTKNISNIIIKDVTHNFGLLTLVEPLQVDCCALVRNVIVHTILPLL